MKSTTIEPAAFFTYQLDEMESFKMCNFHLRKDAIKFAYKPQILLTHSYTFSEMVFTNINKWCHCKVQLVPAAFFYLSTRRKGELQEVKVSFNKDAI